MLTPLDGIVCDPQHRYWHGDRALISVTQTLRAAGWIDDRWWTDEARLRGEYVHLAIALYEASRLDWSSLHPRIEPYVMRYVEWRDRLESIGRYIFACEEMVADLTYGYAGRFDLLFGDHPERPAALCLVDVKTGSSPWWAAIQLAAYAHAIRHRLPPAWRELPLSRFSLQLTPDSATEYDYRDPRDRGKFFAALTSATTRIEHGLARVEYDPTPATETIETQLAELRAMLGVT